MATHAQVRKIAMALPGVRESDAPNDFGFSVENKGKHKGFVWLWKERVDPKKPRVPNRGVIAVRVPNLAQKDLIIASDPAKFFTEPHYNGFPAVLVRLAAVTVADLEALIPEAWRCLAPKALLADIDGAPAPAAGARRKSATKAKRGAPRSARGDSLATTRPGPKRAAPPKRR